MSSIEKPRIYRLYDYWIAEVPEWMVDRIRNYRWKPEGVVYYCSTWKDALEMVKCPV